MSFGSAGGIDGVGVIVKVLPLHVEVEGIAPPSIVTVLKQLHGLAPGKVIVIGVPSNIVFPHIILSNTIS